MERETFIRKLEQIEEDNLYRTLYRRNPSAFEEPVRNWEEFCIRYLEQTGGEQIFLPEVPPTNMADLFKETKYFSKEMHEAVSVVVNARYCPAFLHKLEVIKIIYVFRGNCWFYLNGNWIAMTAGNACIVAPDVEQTIFSCADEDIVLNLLIRRSTFVESFGELLEVDEGGVIADFFWKMLYHKSGGKVMLFRSKPHLLLEESVIELYEEVAESPVKSVLVMKSIMVSIIAYILRWNEKDAVCLDNKEKQDRYPLARYMQYMKEHMEEVTLTSLADEFHMSEGYLSRYFKRETGYTFSHLLREMKIKRSAELLIKTECSIEKIIALVGYADQSIFFRNFRSAYGMTPIVYRKKKRQAEFMSI